MIRHAQAGCRAWWLLLAALTASPAVAQEPTVPRHQMFEEAPPPPEPIAPPRRLVTAGVQVDVSHQFHQAMMQVYERKSPFGLSIFANVLFDERVGLGVVAGLQRRAGTGVAPEGEPPEVVLWQVPVALEGWLRMALWRDQPVVPYVRAGVGVVLAWEKVFLAGVEDPAADPAAEGEAEEDEGRPVPDSIWFGKKMSVHGAGGVQIRLPFPEIQWEGGMTGFSPLSDIYLHIEGWGRAANDFSKTGVDLSAVGASAGITVMF